jgi:hypothetical protein
MSARLERDLRRERSSRFWPSASVCSLLLASLGLYGVLSYGVARQTQEMASDGAGRTRSEVMGSVLKAA